MFKNAIVRRPGRSLVHGITSAPELGTPVYEKALEQHDAYIKALEKTGVEVTVLPALEDYPDSCFVEDTAVITPNVAVISNPGAETRREEADLMTRTIQQFFPGDKIEYIKGDGRLEGGDVMMAGNHFYVGASARTNAEGIRQFLEILKRHGHTGSEVRLSEMLHLKTGVNYLENNNMLVYGEFTDKPEFADFNKTLIADEESYAANCIWMNDFVIVPKGYPKTLAAVRGMGYKTLEVDTSEYKKLDGGLSCLSLRFTAIK